MKLILGILMITLNQVKILALFNINSANSFHVKLQAVDRNNSLERSGLLISTLLNKLSIK